MHYREESEGVPRMNVSLDFVEQEWYKVLTRKVTSIAQLDEWALVAAGISMLWAPQNPRGVLSMGTKGKVLLLLICFMFFPNFVMRLLMLYFTAGYSLMNVLDPKAGGFMVVAILPEGRLVWLDQIRDCFLHPTSESLVTYANSILGEDSGDDLDDAISPTREELETRKKKKGDKSEEKKAEEPAAKAPRYKRAERDPNDDATLTKIVKKKKALEDKKKELEEQAAAALAEKKSRFQKETTTAPSESEVDLGVFSAKPGNLLEKMYKSASGSRGLKPGKGARKVDVSKITPPTSPPSRTFDQSPPHADPGEKRKEDDVEVEQVGEGGSAGAGGGDGRGGGVDTEVESSEATPRHTIYTKRVRSSGEGGAF
ncbi:hypothetical protein HanXRQr2_Chr16g0735591 [Helianthus annuus]|uniref:Uncharacterized protein n=1 Tax=Helianthus annuus TaxID=4232 RepID=A0A9K3DR89_HELAN|nr:hypothetical protein HanXRQr2_Chr16g0735591 [Helianthus annuus]KAJ0437248.1 hypothetical protein HanHA300_Chr16g0599861 [Helianthus annuus]KAJ0459557.1 hypothetical protein HanHA89_Chr16g0650311 [Helianthus annuus]